MGSLKKGIIFVISGPSGSGKTTLAKELLRAKALKGRLVKPASFTTRPQRPGEVEGKDYCFISEKRFHQLQQAKKILEWTKYLGYYYATSKDFISRQRLLGKHIVLCLDAKGAQKIRRAYPKEAVTVFIMPPSLEALRSRIKKRVRSTRVEEIARRLRLAKKELAQAQRYDHRILNHKLASAQEALKKIVLEKINID